MVRHFGQIPHNSRSGVKLLDLGCGQGSSTWYLLREGYNVTAVDGSIDAVAKMRTWLKGEGFSPITLACDMENLPFPDDYFDGVIDIVSVAHNANFNEIYAEAARVTKPGGRLLSMAPTPDTNREAFANKGTISFIPKEELEAALFWYYETKIGWVKSCEDGNPIHTLCSWVIDGIKI